MPDLGPRLAPGVRLRPDPLTGESLLLFPEGVLRLNRTGAATLDLCDGRTPLPSVVDALARRFSAHPSDVLDDTLAFVADLRERGLLNGPLPDLHPVRDRTVAGDPAEAFAGRRPLGLLAELTYRCPLHCPYCSNPSQTSADAELTTAEWERVLDEAGALGVLHVHFSGGEPLLRPDLPDLVRSARQAGLYTNLLTSGVPLTRPLAERLRDAGLDHVQLSVQSDQPAEADTIAGARVHAGKLAVARMVEELGWPLTLNVVLHRSNLARVPALIALAESLGARRLELANVQFYGWAHVNREALLPDRAALEEVNRQVETARDRLRGRMEVLYVASDVLAQRPKACMGGWGRHYLTVNPVGDVLPCPTAGCIPTLGFENVRDRALALIWEESEAFRRFRGTEWMPEPCRSCDRREVDFGGCRCQAFLLTGDATATDPACALSPHREALMQAVASASAWQPRQDPKPSPGNFLPVQTLS